MKYLEAKAVAAAAAVAGAQKEKQEMGDEEVSGVALSTCTVSFIAAGLRKNRKETGIYVARKEVLDGTDKSRLEVRKEESGGYKVEKVS